MNVINSNSLFSLGVLFMEDRASETWEPVGSTCVPQRGLHRTQIAALPKDLSAHDAIWRHAPTRPRKGGKAGLRCRVCIRGAIQPCAGRESDPLPVLPPTPPADWVGNGAEQSWPGGRAYTKPICATVFAMAVEFRVCWQSFAQRGKTRKSSPTYGSAGPSGITSFADGAARATEYSGRWMPCCRPRGDTAISARSSSIAPAILISRGSAACRRKTRADATSHGPLPQKNPMARLTPATRTTRSGQQSHDDTRGHRAVA